MSFWSKIFKSNATESNSAADKETNETSSQLTDDEKQQIKSQIKDLTEQLNDSNSESVASNKQKATVLTQLGQNYQKLGNVDDAIDAYEKSLKLNEDFGPAFDGLLKLYDIKRQKAAYAKDNDEIQKWLNKGDELTALSKKIMRSK